MALGRGTLAYVCICFLSSAWQVGAWSNGAQHAASSLPAARSALSGQFCSTKTETATLARCSAEPPSLRILSKHNDILAINKRFGQRMDGNFPGTIEKLCLEQPDLDKFRPIHQLDFATSGVLLIGMSKPAAARARKAFDSGRVRKCYLAILEGKMTEDEMYIDEPISSYEGPTTLPPRGDPGTHRGARDFRMMVGHGGEGNRGKPAQTRIIKLATGLLAGRACTKVALFPYTGRRHQLRLHSAHVGHAILGDWTYGDRDLAEALPRMYLHAWKLQMRLPDDRGRWSGSDEDSTWTAEDPFDKIENLEPILPKLSGEDSWICEGLSSALRDQDDVQA